MWWVQQILAMAGGATGALAATCIFGCDTIPKALISLVVGYSYWASIYIITYWIVSGDFSW